MADAIHSSRSTIGVLALTAALVAGCYQSFQAPNLDAAPAAVRDRFPLPSCGRTVNGYVGVSSDEDAATCFWEAYQASRSAEYEWYFHSDAGTDIWIYRNEAACTPEIGASRCGLVVYGTRPDGWVRLDCKAFVSTLGDPNLGGPGFMPEGCTETALGP